MAVSEACFIDGVAVLKFYANNTNVVEINGLRNAVTDAYVNDATVTLTVEDADGTEVSGVSWPVAGSYIASSDGIYQIVVATDAVFTVGRKYTAKVTATSGSDVAYWEVPVTVVRRRS